MVWIDFFIGILFFHKNRKIHDNSRKTQVGNLVNMPHRWVKSRFEERCFLFFDLFKR